MSVMLLPACYNEEAIAAFSVSKAGDQCDRDGVRRLWHLKVIASHPAQWPMEGSILDMDKSNSLVRNVSDTARWVAYFRARETLRADALFRDPYAERLAGERGFEIANTLPDGNKHEWAWAARTYLFDQFLSREIQEGTDLVVNLAAGLDARPYRMRLPPNLHWVEVDLPEIISYKEEVLANEKPGCRLERIKLDLSDISGRRALFAELDGRSRKATVASEGLLIYFTPEEVASLAKDLANANHFESWIIDLASPGQLKIMQRTMGKQLGEAEAAFKFGPPEGPNFFVPHGWSSTDVQGLLKTAAQHNRAPAELLSLLPEPKGAPGSLPWTGVCLLKRY
jgi:methyltransferase (TIGR00027 family)